MQLPLFPRRFVRRRYRFVRVLVAPPYHPLTLPKGVIRMDAQGLISARYERV